MRSVLPLLQRIALLIAMLGIRPAGAAETFLVELLVFENIGEAETAEYFPPGERMPSDLPLPATVRFTGPGLPALAATLAKNPAYRILLSSGWQQPLADRASSPQVPVPLTSESRPLGNVGGSLRIYQVSSMIYVETDLGFSPAGGPGTYRIREKRRVKLNEVHYFDHPRFGALLRVSRAQP